MTITTLHSSSIRTAGPGVATRAESMGMPASWSSESTTSVSPKPPPSPPSCPASWPPRGQSRDRPRGPGHRQPPQPASPPRPPANRQSDRPACPWEASSLVTEAADRLWKPEGRQALAYLHGRCLTDETIRAARLGWTPGVMVPREGATPFKAHWYLHNLSSSEDRNLGCEPSQVVEVVMFKQSKHRQQDPEAGQKSWGGVWTVPFHFGGR